MRDRIPDLRDGVNVPSFVRQPVVPVRIVRWTMKIVPCTFAVVAGTLITNINRLTQSVDANL